jgi:lipoprotein-releasing system permease protein
MLVPMLLRGALWGIGIAIGLLAIQDLTGVLTLNPETYYVHQVPVSWNFGRLILLYLIVFLSFTPALFLPWIWIRKMQPAGILKSA